MSGGRRSICEPRQLKGELGVWWKFGGMIALTAMIVVAVIPIRTHAVLYDPAAGPPARQPWWTILENMYLTPVTLLLIVAIIGIAIFAAIKILRREW